MNYLKFSFIVLFVLSRVRNLARKYPYTALLLIGEECFQRQGKVCRKAVALTVTITVYLRGREEM